MKSFQEMAAHLDVVERTLRRWVSLFEEHGYEFEKDDQGRKVFTSGDSRLLVRFKKNTQTMKLEDAVLSVLAKRKKTMPIDTLEPERPDSFNQESVEQLLDDLQEFITSDGFRAALFFEPEKARNQLLGKLKQYRRCDESAHTFV